MRAAATAVLFLAAGLAAAAPPGLEIPAEVRPAGQYVTLSPKTDAVAVSYVGLDGVDPVPSALLKDGRVFLLDSRGLAPGRYRFAAVAAGKTGEQARADFAVVIGDGKKDDPPTPKPKDPPPPPAGPLYFLVVRADGPASPAFTKAMARPEWATIRAAGHLVKDRTATEAADLGVVVPAAQLPAVVTLRVAADGKTSAVARPAVPLPTTGAGVLDLPKGLN